MNIPQKTPTVFFVTKNRINFILRTDLFRILKQRGTHIVLVTPFSNDKAFIKEFEGNNISFEPLYGPGRISLMLYWWRGQALLSDHPLITFGIFAHSFITRRFRPPVTTLIKIKGALRRAIFAFIPSRLRHSPGFWDALENIFISRRCAVNLIKKYRPKAVILGSAGAEETDGSFLLACKKYGVASIVVDTNIDAPQMRYFSPPRDATVYAVFGEEMKNELMEIHRIPERKLIVTGALRYDSYCKGFTPQPRDAFLRSIGANPARKLITFGAKIPIMYPHNADIMKIILDAIKRNEWGIPVQLFVRFDPHHDPERYPEFLPHIAYEKAEVASHREHIANLLYHSDVVLSMASTFCIEASFVNTPGIWVGFDGFTKYKTREESTRIHYDYEVFRRIIASGAIPLAESPEELRALIGRYLSNKARDAEKRHAMLQREYFANDGKAGERIVNIVQNYL